MISKKTVIILLSTVIIVQVLAGIILYKTLGDWTTRGTFGDMFGVVNALFSGLAFVGIIYTIILQSHELSLQRQELEMTRAELKKAADAEEQTARLTKERIEKEYRAYVVIKIALIDYYTYVTIENVGKNPAEDIQMHVESNGDFILGDKNQTPINNLDDLKRPISSIPPGEKINIELGVTQTIILKNSQKKDNVIAFKLKYNSNGMEYEEIQKINIIQSIEYYERKANSSNNLRRIELSLDKISHAFMGIHPRLSDKTLVGVLNKIEEHLGKMAKNNNDENPNKTNSAVSQDT